MERISQVPNPNIVPPPSGPAVIKFHPSLTGSLPLPSVFPASLSFQSVASGVKTTQSAIIYAPSACARIMVSVTDDTSGGRISAGFLEVITLPAPSGPHPPKGPLGNTPPDPVSSSIVLPSTSASKSGQAITLEVTLNPGAAGVYSATLVIQGDGWAPLFIAVEARVGQAPVPQPAPMPTPSFTVAVRSEPTIVQGGSGTLSLSIANPGSSALTVQLSYAPTSAYAFGVAIAPVQVEVAANGSTIANLLVQSEFTALLGTWPMTLYGQTVGMGSPVQAVSISAEATIVRGTVTIAAGVVSNTEMIGQQGATINGQISAVLSGAGGLLKLQPVGLPAGVAFGGPASVDLPNLANQLITFSFIIDPAAPVNRAGTPFRIDWSFDGVSSTGSVPMTIGIIDNFPLQYQETELWCWAATTSAISSYYGVLNFTQCLLANDLLGMNNCCTSPIPNACIQAGDLERSLGITENLAQRYTVPGAYYSNAIGPLSANDLKGQIAFGSPVAIRVQWAASSEDGDFSHPAHAIVASNWDSDDQIAIDDPFYGPTAVPYATLVCAYRTTGIWTDAYTTKSGAPAAGFAA